MTPELVTARRVGSRQLTTVAVSLAGLGAAGLLAGLALPGVPARWLAFGVWGAAAVVGVVRGLRGHATATVTLVSSGFGAASFAWASEFASARLGLADLLWMVGALGIALGALSDTRRHELRPSAVRFLDWTVIVVAVAAAVAALAFAPAWGGGGQRQRALLVVVLTGELLAFAVATYRSVAAAPRWSRQWTAMWIAGWAVCAQSARISPATAGRAIWPLAALAAAIGALVVTSGLRFGRGRNAIAGVGDVVRFLSLHGAAFAVLAFLAFDSRLDTAGRMVLAFAGALLLVVLALRMLLTARETYRLAALVRERDIARGLLYERVVRAQEDERHRMAADLHDGPVQALARVGLEAARSSRLLELGRQNEATAAIETVELGVTQTVTDLRAMMQRLRPPALDERGLAAALEDQASALRASSGPDVRVDACVEGRLPSPLEVTLYRIAQEALTNVQKHAGAQAVRISLSVEGGWAHLMVTDDGVGMPTVDPARLLAAGHYGVAGIIERARLLGGNARWESVEGAGTTLFVELPLSVDGG